LLVRAVQDGCGGDIADTSDRPAALGT